MTDNNTPATAPKKLPLAADPTNFNQAFLIGLLRQGLLALGTLLAGHGLIGPHNTITPENWDFIVGLVIAIAPIAWQWWDKFNTAKTVEEKQRIAVQAALNFAQVAADQQRPLPAVVSKDRAKSIIENHS
jgi:hypothetical protein